VTAATATRHLAEETRRLALVVALPEPAVAPRPLARPRSIVHRIVNALGFVLAIAAVAFWALFLRPASLGGPASYVLVSGKSMLPLYHTGDLVLVEKQSSYHVGDVIAYHVPKGDPMAGAQVIHRIIGGNATTGFIVKGDNRTAPDVWHPQLKDVVGAKALRIPDGAIALRYLRSPLLLGLLAASFVFVTIFTRERPEKPKPDVVE